MRFHASVTAEVVCLLRATGTDDPFAERFLSPPFRALLAAWRRTPGIDAATLHMRAAVLARHRFIDEALARSGAAQAVLLGAGYDSRPWRLPGPRYFEVDHPATLGSRLRRAARLPSTGAVRVPADLSRADPAAALRAAGFDASRSSFFVWEGVSMYLPRSGVVRALERVASLLVPGSAVAFDAWSPVGGAVERLGLAGVRLLGEPIRCAIAPDAVPTLLEEAGLAVRELVAADVFAARAGLGVAYPGLSLVEAVPHPAKQRR